MRVMHLTTDLELGGAERVIIDLMRCLRARGVETAVAGLAEGREGGGKVRAMLEPEGFEVGSAGMWRRRMVWRIPRLCRFVRRWRPDVLHCHLGHAHSVGAFLRAGGLKCPQVWTHHSVDRRRRPGRGLFYRFSSRTAACHVYVSDAVRRFQHRRGGAADWEEVIHNGVELAPLLAVQPAAGPVFGAVGRLVPEKGYDVLIRAFARFAAEQPEARLVIAGAGAEQAALERLIRAEGLAGRASLAGFVDDVPGFLARLNAFLAPSRWESFGLTLLEALAAGLPCAASRVDGMVEVGGDLVHWVAPDDAAGLCDAMRRLWGAPADPERIARQRGRASRFSREAMTDRYLGIYRALCDRTGARPLQTCE